MPLYRFTVTLQDERNGETQKIYEGDFADFATADTAASALLTDIQNLTTAQVVETVGPAPVTPVSGAPAAGSRVTERITATVKLTTANKNTNMQFPSPVAAALSGNSLDTGAAVWTDYIANFTTGNWYVSDGEHVNGSAASDTVNGKLITVRSGRRTLPT
jgi:hypothetical protein